MKQKRFHPNNIMVTYQHVLSLSLFFFLAFCFTGTCAFTNGNVGKKLFVFGDSYVDTGNSRPNGGPRHEPYGITYPGKPSGRYSDGRCLTDYIASYLGIPTPAPFENRNVTKRSQLRHGMNFAYGGSGLFSETFNPKNLLFQINNLKTLINEELYSQADLNSSTAFVHTSGNDYSKFQQTPRTADENWMFMKRVIQEMARNLKSIYDMGIPKVAVLEMVPAGCIPVNSIKNASFPESCEQTRNEGCKKHNRFLRLAVDKLNKQVNRQQAFVVIDTYNGFLKAMDNHARTTEDSRYKNPSNGCCKGDTVVSCGMVDNATSTKMYTLCDHPDMSFFFDVIHPSQHGSEMVYLALQDSLKQLLS